MNNKKRGIGLWVVVLVCVFIGIIVSEGWNLLAASDYTYSEFQQDIQNKVSQIEDVVISPNKETPTGMISVEWKNSSKEESFYVTDVNQVKEWLESVNYTDYKETDVINREGWFYNNGALLVLGGIFLWFLFSFINSQQSGGNAQAAKGTIVLDPGHGGDDPGMIGESGINEKKLNLIYAKKLQTLLEAKGYRVVLTRETEEGLYDADAAHKKAQDMQRRVAIIAEEAPLITVSIHQNSYTDPGVKGPQVFYYEHSEEGRKAASCIQDALNTMLDVGRPREIKANDTYYLLKRTKSAVLIVECGFLSCPEEEEKLNQESYQQMVAEAVCAGAADYLNGKKAA